MEDTIRLGHGSGGKLMNELINGLIRETFGESLQLDDSAVLPVSGDKIVFTTDTFTITPIFFPGGNIGELAVYGTVNDLAVMGAVPKYISSAFVLEEGFSFQELKTVVQAMKKAADYAGVAIVTGDTKVVEKGKGDKIFINTAGIGLLESPPQRKSIEPGDLVICNGSLGDHGISVMAQRNGLSFSKGLSSDTAPLNHLVKAVLDKYPNAVKFMRDATRGGAASVLNEVVQEQPFSVALTEEDLPIKDEVRGVCDILGLDPLYAANEGKLIMIVDKEAGAGIVEIMRSLTEGKEAAIIGEITQQYPGKVYIQTAIGGKRLLPLLSEEQLPRIC